MCIWTEGWVGSTATECLVGGETDTGWWVGDTDTEFWVKDMATERESGLKGKVPNQEK